MLALLTLLANVPLSLNQTSSLSTTQLSAIGQNKAVPMHRHSFCALKGKLVSFSLATVTLLLALTSTVKVTGTSLDWTAEAQAQTIQEQKPEAVRLYELGTQQFNNGQFQQALQTFQQVLGIVRSLGERQAEGVTLNNIGLVYDNLDEYPQALKFYEQALVILKQVGDRAEESATLNNMGTAYQQLGQHSQALKCYEQALVILKQTGDKAKEGTTLNNIGAVYRHLGNYPQALKFFEQALIILKQTGDKAEQGATLNNIGLVYDSAGQYSQALKFYQQALAIVQQVGYKAGEGATLNNIGEAHRHLEEYSQALKFFEQALAIRRQVGDKVGEGVTLNNIGAVYNYLGDDRQALKFYEQALASRKQAGDKAGEGATLNNIGAVYNYLGQYAQALQHYEQALVIVKQVGDKVAEGITLNNIGRAYQSLGQKQQGLQFYKQALVIAQQADNKLAQGATLNNIGSIYNSLGQSANAERTLLAAIEIWESLQPGLTDASQASMLETQAITYRLLQQALVVQNKTNAALEISERGKARAFVELLASRQAENPNDRLTVKPLSIQQIQLIAKEQNATLVDYSTVADKLFIWTVQPTGKVAFKQVSLKSLKTSLEDLVTSSLDSIGTRGSSGIEVNQKGLQHLHQLLIQPIADKLPKNPDAHVIFIPQPSLYLAPFPALQDGKSKYLIEQHTILTSPSIQLLALTRKQRQYAGTIHKLPPKGTNALIVGNPTILGIATQIGQPPLSGAEAEAIEIAKLLDAKALTGNQATKASVVQQMPKAEIIHLATHGLLDDFQGLGVPGAIALAPSGNGLPNDGLLTSSEILDMKLNAELVVLSAGDTSTGKITGDGIIGLSRSLISAGVPSVLVSLWSVPDTPKAFLMTEFYRNLQQKPDKAQALRQAMLKTMKQYPNPKDWAAFTLIGEAE